MCISLGKVIPVFQGRYPFSKKWASTKHWQAWQRREIDGRGREGERERGRESAHQLDSLLFAPPGLHSSTIRLGAMASIARQRKTQNGIAQRRRKCLAHTHTHTKTKVRAPFNARTPDERSRCLVALQGCTTTHDSRCLARNSMP